MTTVSGTLLTSVLFCALLYLCAAPPPSNPGKGKGNGRDDDGKGNGNGNGNGKGGGNGKGVGGWKGNQRHIDDDALKAMQTTWSKCKGKGQCKDKGDRQKRNRNAVKLSLTKRGKGRPSLDDATAEKRFKKTLQAKKALFTVNGLNDVEPHDNGLIGGDMILDETQLDRIISRTQGVVDANNTAEVPLLDVDSLPSNPLTGGNARAKRADSLALDYYTGNKWPTTTINFYIDPNDFTSTEAGIIRKALMSISSASCLKFVEGWKTPVMEYVKAPGDTDDGTCGWANVGYQGTYNAININFASSICKPTLQGVVIHETLHSLGFGHEHARYDRDRYLKIDWNNVDPQSYDVYNKDDPQEYNPYCVSFDPLSIMHYDPYVGALDSSKAVMTPVSYASYYLPKMGQGTTMAASDAKLLNKMYCTPATCKDKSVNCGWTACGSCSTYTSVCAKSCGAC